MELLALIIVWPFLILSVGLAFIALGDIGFGFHGWWQLLFWPLVIGAIFVWLKVRRMNVKKSAIEQLEIVRGWVIVFSIALLLPVFTRYLIETFSTSLGAVIAGFVLSFAIIVWGMFMGPKRRILMYGNIVGGALSLIYVYTQLWELGQLARVIAAGFGLVVAVGVAVAKLKDKLS